MRDVLSCRVSRRSAVTVQRRALHALAARRHAGTRRALQLQRAPAANAGKRKETAAFLITVLQELAPAASR